MINNYELGEAAKLLSQGHGHLRHAAAQERSEEVLNLILELSILQVKLDHLVRYGLTAARMPASTAAPTMP